MAELSRAAYAALSRQYDVDEADVGKGFAHRAGN